MGIFSIFKKKQDEEAAAAALSGLPTRSGEPSRLAIDGEAERQRQREIARATAMKIDAIESAMTLDIFESADGAWPAKSRRGPRPAYSNADAGPHPTLPMLELATTELLGEDELPEPAPDAETAPVIEEAAILYANGQVEAARALLTASLDEGGQGERAVWWMLFDLLQVDGAQADFDELGLAYAGRFETSPPAYRAEAALAAAPVHSGLEPTEMFGAALDAGIAPQLARVRAQAASASMLRLDFSRVRKAEAEGCTLLLATLRSLREGERELVVVGAPELAALLRAGLETGRREAPPAPWLLLLELLLLMHEERDFEDVAMDYCVTYEVSPPSYEPRGHAATPARERASASDRFLLPPLIEGDCAELLAAVAAYAAEQHPAVLDCSRLARIDYHAAGQLLEVLRPLAGAGKKIELRELNHPVAALLRLLGYPALARLYPHNY